MTVLTTLFIKIVGIFVGLVFCLILAGGAWLAAKEREEDKRNKRR